MKKLLFFLVVPLFAFGCALQPGVNNNGNNASTTSNIQNEAQGRVVFSITDASDNLTDVTSVKMMADKLEVHSAALGWVVVSTQPKIFDLLRLKQLNTAQILADIQIPEGTYDQIRLHINSVTAVKGGVETQVKLPSNELKIVGRIVVSSKNDASVLLDFLLDKSMHLTGNNTFIFTPVIKIESKSNVQIKLKSDGVVEVKNGKEEENKTVGSDENGEIKTDFEINDKIRLDLTSDGAIHAINEDQSEEDAKINVDQAVKISLDSDKIDTVISIRLEKLDDKKVWHITGTSASITTNIYVNANTGAIVLVK